MEVQKLVERHKFQVLVPAVDPLANMTRIKLIPRSSRSDQALIGLKVSGHENQRFSRVHRRKRGLCPCYSGAVCVARCTIFLRH